MSHASIKPPNMDQREIALQEWAGPGWKWWHSGGGIWVLEKEKEEQIPGIEEPCYMLLSLSEQEDRAIVLGAYSSESDQPVAYLKDARMDHVGIGDCLRRIKEPAFREPPPAPVA